MIWSSGFSRGVIILLLFLVLLVGAFAWLVSNFLKGERTDFIRSRRTAADFAAIAKALDMYKRANHQLPPPQSGADLGRFLGLRKPPLGDGWQKPFVYAVSDDGMHYRLISGGRDGQIERRFIRVTAEMPEMRTFEGWDDDIVVQDGVLCQINEDLKQLLGRDLRKPPPTR